LGIDLQVAEVFVDRRDLMDVHAPLDAPPARAGLVDGEVVPRSVAERDEDAPERRRVTGEPLRVSAGHAGQERTDLLHHRARRQDEVHDTRPDRALRHSGVRGALCLLRHRHPGVSLDRLQPERPVGPRPRQDHADRTLALVVRQGAEEIVDGQRHVAIRVAVHHVEHALEHGHGPAGHRQIHVVRRQPHAVGRLDDGHPGVLLKEIRQQAHVS
jgi:hypothetical protein